MGLREQEYREICAAVDCPEWASVACLRCGRPLCSQHQPAEDRRCGDCEREYEQQAGDATARVKGVPEEIVSGFGLTGSLAFGSVLFLSIGWGLAGFLGSAGLALVGIGGGRVLTRFQAHEKRCRARRALREGFMSERPPGASSRPS